jgi:hypothetical protein
MAAPHAQPGAGRVWVARRRSDPAPRCADREILGKMTNDE